MKILKNIPLRLIKNYNKNTYSLSRFIQLIIKNITFNLHILQKKYYFKFHKLLPFVYKCSVKSDSNDTNTSTEANNSTHGQGFNQNLSEHIPNENHVSYGQKTDSSILQLNHPSKKENLMQDLHTWIETTYAPTHFLTVRLPENHETDNYDNAVNILQMIMKSFEKRLLGTHWHRKHIPFICFAEKGQSIYWHFHLLFNQKQFSNEDLDNAIFKVNQILNLPQYCLLLKDIDNKDGIKGYCSKEIKVFYKNKFDSECIILSHNLFNVACKNPTNLISDVKKVGNDN